MLGNSITSWIGKELAWSKIARIPEDLREVACWEWVARKGDWCFEWKN